MTSILLKLDSSKISNQKSHNFTIHYSPPIQLDEKKNYEISLLKAWIWYSWYNISEAKLNNVIGYSPDGGTTFKNITLPNGNYDIFGINAYLQSQMKINGDYDEPNEDYFVDFIPNYNTGKLRIELSNNYQIDLTQSKIYNLLGFNKQIVATTIEGSRNVDITSGISSLSIHCSLVNNSYNNDVKGDTIQSFSPDKPVSSQLYIEDNNPVYINLEHRRIAEINMYLTDQNNELVDLNGEITNYLLHIKEIK